MKDTKLGAIVFVAAAAILTKPSHAQSPAMSGAALTVEVEKLAVRLPANVNGVPVRFLVDTGADLVAFSWEDARKLGVTLNALQTGHSTTADGTKHPSARARLAGC